MKSCQTCLRGPEIDTASLMCRHCGDDLDNFVQMRHQPEAEASAHMMSAPSLSDEDQPPQADAEFLALANKMLMEKIADLEDQLQDANKIARARKQRSGIFIESCPFCGNDEVVIDENEDNEYFIGCPECQASGPITEVVMDAISYWNDRRGCDVATA